MTHIVSPSTYHSKKSLIEAVKAGRNVYVDDPSLFSPVSGELRQVLAAIEAAKGKGASFVITNHPKRTWFAQVLRNAKGEVVVK